ncbi:MAG: 4Fe-4S binding protein, partial [Clostridia bacterium]|nr:4Fe-4S binding protein [Clostridia bacterium]
IRCGKCISVCPEGALSYSFGSKKAAPLKGNTLPDSPETEK